VADEGEYVIRGFHPLVLFYVLGLLMTVVGFLLGIVVIARGPSGQRDHAATVVLGRDVSLTVLGWCSNGAARERRSARSAGSAPGLERASTRRRSS
jgi:hypothetical protein